MNFLTKKNLIKITYIISAITLAIPSYVYIINNKTICDSGLEFRFLFTDNNRILQAVLYGITITLMVILYLIILKYRKKIFKDFKDVLIYTILFSSVFIFTLPSFSHDVYYYMGIGRLNSQYLQNPYYVSMKDFVEKEAESVDLTNDEVMETGANHYWANTTVVYGATWTAICAILSKLSFGKVGICLLLFKIANLLIHIANCYLIYKISKKKLFSLIYGLSPFMIIESIVNVHNDIFMIFFILLSFYELLKRKSIIKSVIFLGIATSIKYFAILFLPFTIIYYFKKEKAGKRLLRCIAYGLLFFIIVAIPYCLYFRDIKVLNGIAEQQSKYAKSLGIILVRFGYKKYNIPKKCLLLFTIYYAIKNIILLVKDDIKLGKEMRQLFYYLLIFTFILVTNFQPWYMVWLMSLMIWQDSKNIRLIIQITIIALYGYIIYMLYDDIWVVGANYSLILLIMISLCLLVNNLRTEIKRKFLRGEIEYENIEK